MLESVLYTCVAGQGYIAQTVVLVLDSVILYSMNFIQNMM